MFQLEVKTVKWKEQVFRNKNDRKLNNIGSSDCRAIVWWPVLRFFEFPIFFLLQTTRRRLPSESTNHATSSRTPRGQFTYRRLVCSILEKDFGRNVEDGRQPSSQVLSGSTYTLAWLGFSLGTPTSGLIYNTCRNYLFHFSSYNRRFLKSLYQIIVECRWSHNFRRYYRGIL